MNDSDPYPYPSISLEPGAVSTTSATATMRNISAARMKAFQQQLVDMANQKESQLRKPNDGEKLRIAAKKAIWKDELGTIERYCRKCKISMDFDNSEHESYVKGLLVGRLIEEGDSARHKEYKEIAEFYISQNRSSVFRNPGEIEKLEELRIREIEMKMNPPIMVGGNGLGPNPFTKKQSLIGKFFKSFA